MNRTEQTPEPTMEEILASIRLIISDDSKKAPPVREDHSPAPMPEAAVAPLNALPAEDVLDLTDELVFPEERSAPASTMTPSPSHAVAAEDAPGEEPPHEAPDLTTAPPEPSQAAEMPHAMPSHMAPPEARHDGAQRSASAPSRTVWSRRELPGSSGPVAAANPRLSQEAAPSRQPPRSWAQDVQMAIPDQGPMSLIPGQIQAQKPEPEETSPSSGDMEEETGVTLSAGPGDKNEAGVAAFTEDLIRTAVSAMDAEELATAAEIDFDELDGGRTAEVAERVAAAIQKEHKSQDESPLPTLLDEMRRRNFFKEPETFPEPDDQSADADAPASPQDESLAAHKPRFDFAWETSMEAAPQSEEIAPVPTAPVLRAAERPSEQTAAVQRQPSAVVLQPVPAAGGQTLEDAVRDMLRPMLMQWLNENMPRILEGAIREEIATRGLSLNAKK